MRGRDPGEYTERPAGSLLAEFVTAPGQLPISARFGHRMFTGTPERTAEYPRGNDGGSGGKGATAHNNCLGRVMISRRPGAVLACAVVVVVAVLSGLSWPAVAATDGKSQLAKTSRRCPRASYGAHSYAPGRGKTVALTWAFEVNRDTGTIW